MARNFVSGSSQYIEFPSISLGSSYTVACRFKVSTAGVAHSLFAQRSTTTGSRALFDLEIQSSNLMRFFVFGDASEFANLTAAAPVLNQWHTLVGRRNGNDFNLFRDGVDAASTTVTMGAITANSLNIGAVVNGDTTRVSFLNGDMAECAIWNIDLTADEIAAYHSGVSPLLIRPTNLFRYYPLYGTTQEADLSGSGDIGTNNGSTASGFHSPSGQYKKRSIYSQSSLLKEKQLEHIYKENLTDESQTSTVWRTILQVDKSELVPLAKYWIFVVGNISSNNVSNLTRVRILNDSGEELGSRSDQVVKTVIGSSDGLDYHFSKVLDISETPGDIELQISNSAASETHLTRSMIFMLRLDKDFKEGRDYLYEENQLISKYTTSFGNATALSNSMESPIELLGSGEDYFAIMSMATLANTALDDLRKNQLVFALPGLNYSMDIINRSTSEEQLSVKGGIGTFPATSGLMAQTKFAVNNSGTENEHKWSSVFMIRKNLFAQAIGLTNTSTQLPTDTALNQTLDLTITPAKVGDFVAFGFASVGFESGSSAGLKNGLIAFRNGGALVPLNEDGEWGADSETNNERNPLTTMAYFPNLPASAQTIELMIKGNQASQVNFGSRTAFLISLLPANRFKIQGIVQESGSNVSRTVRAFLSSTGEFLGETISHPDTGAYEISDIPGGNIFVVAFDDAGGDSFNAQIFDKVVPVE